MYAGIGVVDIMRFEYVGVSGGGAVYRRCLRFDYVIQTRLVN